MRVRRPPHAARGRPARRLDLRRSAPPRLEGLLGATAPEALDRLGGEPAGDRSGAEERWLRFEGEGWSLRVRLAATPDGERVASWTLALEPGARTLREAAEPVGLWPACAPDAEARAVTAPLLRRILPDLARGVDRSLTASVRGGRIVAITAFDEPPDWLS